MAAKSPAGTGRALVSSQRSREAIVRRLSAITGTITTAVTQEMEHNHDWFGALGAEERSWIALVVRAGIDGFAGWFLDDTNHDFTPSNIFNVAPRAMTRKITLQQTVALVRTTIAVMETEMGRLMPRGDRGPLQTAIVHYSREVAFAAAEVYARVAESRSSWDEHAESMIIDAVVRGDDDESLLSRAATLGWPATTATFCVVGNEPAGTQHDALPRLRRAAEQAGLSILADIQGQRMIALLVRPDLTSDRVAADAVSAIQEQFGAGQIVVGPVVDGLLASSTSAQEAISGASAVKAWPEGPRIVAATELLPERVLAGDFRARRQLIRNVYQPLLEAGGDLLETCIGFLSHGSSIEATARALYVHGNTVRYRIKRIQDVTGLAATESRAAYALRLAITLGRLNEH